MNTEENTEDVSSDWGVVLLRAELLFRTCNLTALSAPSLQQAAAQCNVTCGVDSITAELSYIVSAS